MHLSPLNFRALLAREVFDYGQTPQPQKARKSAREVILYECPECSARYDWEDEAEECCQGKDKAPTGNDHQSYATHCPVCGEKSYDAEGASDCCLWKDIDAVTRHAMARRVELGSTWAQELRLWPPTFENLA